MAPSSASARYKVLLSVVSLALLPLLTFTLFFNYAAVVLLDQRKLTQRIANRYPKTILITGTTNVYGLNLARALRRAGYRVVGADVGCRGILRKASLSRAISRHYDLPELSAVQDATYIGGLIFQAARKEKACLWIDCSQNLSPRTIYSAQQLIEQQLLCLCISSEGDSKQHFRDRAALFELLRGCDLPTPEFHRVKSRGQIHNVLNGSQGKKKFALESGDKKSQVNGDKLLPKRTLSQTYSDVALVKITPGSSLLLEERLDVKTMFTCFALVVRGGLSFFQVQQKILKQYEPMRSENSLRRALQSYTEAVARGLDASFTGHLFLSFGLIEQITHSGVIQQIYPVEGSIRLQPDIAMSIDRVRFDELAVAYGSVTDSLHNGYISTTPANDTSPLNSEISRQRYILLQAITDLFLLPLAGFLLYRTGSRPLLDSWMALFYNLLLGNEAYYDPQDPLPAYWQNTVGFVLES